MTSPPADARPEPATDAPRRAPWAAALAGLSLLWLIATLSSVRHGLGAPPELDPLTAARAAVSLPSVVSANLVAAVATGLAVTTLVARRAPALLTRAVARYSLGAATGVLLGGSVAALTAVGYGGTPALLPVYAAMVAAGAAGGLAAAAPQPKVVAAGVLGVLAVFLAGFAFAVFDGDLLALFGAGDTEASVLTANAWVAFVSSLTAGLLAGGLAYAYLRRYGGAPRWPRFLVAGAAPGALMLLSEALTRLGGLRLFRLVSEAAADQTYLQYLAAARLNRALIVLFAGALLAIFLLGRSLPTAEEGSEPEPPGEPGSTDRPEPPAGA